MRSTPPTTEWQLTGLTRRVSGWLAAAIGLGGLAAVLFVWQLSTLAQLVDSLTFKGQGLSTLRGEFLKTFLLCAASLSLQWVADIAGTHAGLRISTAVQQDGIAHIFKAGPVGCATQATGQLVTTLTESTAALTPYFAQYLPRAAMMVVLPLLILGVTLHLDSWSFVVLLCTGPLVPVFMALVGYSAQAIMDRQWVNLVIMGASFLDNLTGLRTLRLFAQTQSSAARMAAQTEAHRSATFAVMRVAFLTSAVLEFFASLSIALVAVLFGARLLHGTVDFRSAFLVLLLAPEYFMPLRAFSASYHAKQNATAAAKRLSTLFALPTTIQPRANKPERQNKVQATLLTCAPFSVAYQGATPQLSSPETRFQVGGLSILSGESGAGKTTFLRAILGFLPLPEGSLKFYDAKGQSLPPDTCRMAWLPQKPLMVFGSIAQNLRLAAPTASQMQLEKACAQADILEFINSLPDGFNTFIGDRGSLLSGGQLKRLALARALLGNPDVLCLDEPTANLDTQSAGHIIQTLLHCAKTRIVIAATHDARLSAHAAQIMLVENGYIFPLAVEQKVAS